MLRCTALWSESNLSVIFILKIFYLWLKRSNVQLRWAVFSSLALDIKCTIIRIFFLTLIMNQFLILPFLEFLPLLDLNHILQKEPPSILTLSFIDFTLVFIKKLSVFANVKAVSTLFLVKQSVFAFWRCLTLKCNVHYNEQFIYKL